MSDRIEIRGLRAETIVGVHAHERTAPRALVIDLELDTDLRVSGASDEIADTVDYDALAEKVRAAVATASHKLIETIAHDVAKVCLGTPNVRQVTVTIHKPGAVTGCDDVAVRITR